MNVLTVLKWAGLILGALVLIIAAYLYGASTWRLNTHYDVEPADLAVPTDSAAVGRGRHIAVTRGCADCHGDNLGGAAFIDNALMGRIYGPNLTSGRGGIGGTYSNADWIRALRHGIGPDGESLVFMPSYEYYYLSDRDLGALIAYLKQLPPVDHTAEGTSIGPMGRMLILTGELKLPAEQIDHEAPRPDDPTPGPTAAYGAYLAKACTGCHGQDFTGGPIPAAPPSWPPATNITPHSEDGIGDWSQEDFIRALRQQVRPDGSAINPVMPKEMGKMTDQELTALWKYLQRLPPRPSSGD
jgi:cytochrome c553